MPLTHDSSSRFAVIFDLDGTLVDSLDDITAAVNVALAAMRRPPVSSQRVRDWVGDGLPTLCRRAWPDADDQALDALIRLAADHYSRHAADRTRPYPNILPLLDLLAEASVPLAVLSNKPHAITQRVVDAMNLRAYFKCVQGYERESDKKPSPVMPRRVSAALCVDPARTILAGDSVVDVETARNAGMMSVAVTWGFQARRRLEEARPDFLVGSPLEILSLSPLKNFFPSGDRPPTDPAADGPAPRGIASAR